MSTHRNGRTFIGLVALGALLALIAPVGAQAGERLGCRAENAPIFRTAGDRFNRQRNFAEAARWYLAAAGSTRACSAPGEALLTARSLAQAGTALAQGGDSLGALGLLRDAKARLLAISRHDRKTADAARAFLDPVQRAISAVEELARESM